MAYKKGDRVYWNYGYKNDPNYWTGTVMEDELNSRNIIWRVDGYPYSCPYVKGNGENHNHFSEKLFLMPVGMKLSTSESIFASSPELRNNGNMVMPSATLINDYVCKRCKNNRLSRIEKSCWSCGETITL